MYREKLCLGLMSELGDRVKQVKLIADTGFEGYFACIGHELRELKKAGDEAGITLQSIHAPFSKMDAMWYESDMTQAAVDELIDSVRQTADVEAPITVIHAFIGFEKHSPTALGIETFGKVVQEAGRLGVKVAFENTEGGEYLAALMDAFKGEKHVGFCWDTGHEMCYNRSKDMLALYGDRLFCTHINDNLGINDFGGEITWIDDLHLLPFDGIGNWQDIAARLDRHGFNDFLTFELTTGSKPGRYENDVYKKLSPEEYLAEAYKRACRVASLRQH